ncbi:MAG TPA: hypothetical protein VFA66_07290 [Gaiellaceae bacterium]|nr:hypothetical protein [Gaiellaceae bacterium]
MPPSFTAAQRELAKEVLERHEGDPQLLAALDNDELSQDERIALCDLFTEDLAVRGFGANYAPTALGRQLEELIDVLSATD